MQIRLSLIIGLLPITVLGRITPTWQVPSSIDEMEPTEESLQDIPEYGRVITKTTHMIIGARITNKLLLVVPQYSDVLIWGIKACTVSQATFKLTDEFGMNIPLDCEPRYRDLRFKGRDTRYALSIRSDEPFQLRINYEKYIFGCGEEMSGYGDFLVEFPANHPKRNCDISFRGECEVEITRLDQDITPLFIRLQFGRLNRRSFKYIHSGQIGQEYPTFSRYIWCNEGSVAMKRPVGDNTNYLLSVKVKPIETEDQMEEMQQVKGDQTCPN